ncbi:cytomegalovirus UL139 protein [Tasmannia lanceolata]|uniref:cytomegalovirus UL139 protein n=1 Tax=Tasmannia lanceolata TaxID=3420 RepID=UPI004062F0BC
MALPSAFQERLQQMEETRNQRLSLLQAEKELQSKKSLLLAAKLSNLRRMEQQCLILDQKNADLSCRILAKKSEIEALDAEYQTTVQRIRVLKSEIDELEEVEKKRVRFYEGKSLEMEEFKKEVERFFLTSRMEVQKMKITVSEIKSSIKELQGNDGYLINPEIAAAEKRKAELLVVKENLDKSLASNYQLRLLLQKQLHNFLISRSRQREAEPKH